MQAAVTAEQRLGIDSHAAVRASHQGQHKPAAATAALWLRRRLQRKTGQLPQALQGCCVPFRCSCSSRGRVALGSRLGRTWRCRASAITPQVRFCHMQSEQPLARVSRQPALLHHERLLQPSSMGDNLG